MSIVKNSFARPTHWKQQEGVRLPTSLCVVYALCCTVDLTVPAAQAVCIIASGVAMAAEFRPDLMPEFNGGFSLQ